ncbi:MAG: M24 family metallopeptidase [Ilumatobacteraceae bacterium]
MTATISTTNPALEQPGPAIVPDFCLPVDVDRRAARERLARLRRTLADHDVGAAVFFDAVNIRYACGVRNMQLNTTRNPGRYVFVPVEGPVVLFEYRSCAHLAEGYETVDEVRAAQGLHPFYGGDHYRDHLVAFVDDIGELMARCGLIGQRLGIERSPVEAVPALLAAGFDVVDASPVIDRAKSIKTPTELELIRASVAGTEAAVAFMEQQLVPGRSENEVWAELHRALIAGGGEYLETRLFNSGPKTNPWFQEAGSKIIEAGELVCLDTDAVGCHGYYTDLSRTFLAGDVPATDRQHELYSLAYEQLQHNIDLVEVGMSFREYAERAWAIPEEFVDHRYLGPLHGNGMVAEYPIILYPDLFDAAGTDGVFEANMTVCVESYLGSDRGGEGVKLEDQILVTNSGVERLTTYPFEDRLLRPRTRA